VRFGFSGGAIRKAMLRQDDGQGMGYPCAKCGTYGHFLLLEDSEWEAMPRIPIEEEGETGDNCVIVCKKCAAEIGQDGTKEIPLSALPYFGG